MKWPQGRFEPSHEWWDLGEEGRKPVMDALALLGFNLNEVRAADFGASSVQVAIIHRVNNSAHMEGHCEKQVVLSEVEGELRCSCGRKMGEGHRLCMIKQEVAYPS